MSETLFIADLHLHPQRPQTIALCLALLTGRARQAEALYILGDLFEVWLGDDEDEPAYQPILATLRQLTCDVPVFVLPGNRDFLLGKEFVATTGCQLLTDMQVIDLYGIPTLLMHGDTLCTLDTAYQSFRQQVRNPLWQQQFLAQPLAQRRILAQQARVHSQAYTQAVATAIMDVTPSAVVAALENNHVYHLIHGHTHRPAIHEFIVNEKPAYRNVVGEWHDNEAIMLSATAAGNQLVTFTG